MAYLNFDRLLLLSIGFFLLFSAFGTAQSLAPNVLQKDGLNNLGFHSLAILYFSFGFCSLFASTVVSKLGPRYSMVLGAFCYSLYIGTFIIASLQAPKAALITAFYITAALNGFGASILWVGQGRYISECATDSNKGNFNSIFWAIYMGSALVGDLFGAFMISEVNEVVFYILMTALCIMASLFFMLLKPPTKVSDYIETE